MKGSFLYPILLTLLVLLLSSCATAPHKKQKEDIYSFFPTTVGCTWVYSLTSYEKNLPKQKTDVIARVETKVGDKVSIRFGKDATLYEVTPNLVKDLTHGFTLIKYPFNPGESWQENEKKVKVIMYPEPFDFKGKKHPAVVVREYRQDMENTYYYARGLGLVKLEITTPTPEGSILNYRLTLKRFYCGEEK